MNTSKLRGKIVEMNMTIPQVAEKLDMSPSTLYRKLEGGARSFTVKDAEELTIILGLSSAEAVSIFFTDIVA